MWQGRLKKQHLILLDCYCDTERTEGRGDHKVERSEKNGGEKMGVKTITEEVRVWQTVGKQYKQILGNVKRLQLIENTSASKKKRWAGGKESAMAEFLETQLLLAATDWRRGLLREKNQGRKEV